MRSFRGLSVLSALILGGFLNGGSSWAAIKEASFTPDQRAEIVQIMRDALKQDPTILTDAVQSLRQKAQKQQEEQSEENIQKNWTSLNQGPDYTIRGNPLGKVTIIEFLDPRCGYCRHMAPVVEAFLKAHQEVRLVEKIVPVLGTASINASRAIFAAALQGHYGSMRDALMADSAAPTAEHLEALAKAQGLDRDRFFKDMNSEAVAGIILAHRSQAQLIGLDGTPTFLFGQHIEIPGALDPDQMERLLDAEKKRL